MKNRFAHIVMRITYDATVQSEFNANAAEFVKRLKLNDEQREALLSKDAKKINEQIEKECGEFGRHAEIEEPKLTERSWPVRQNWPVFG